MIDKNKTWELTTATFGAMAQHVGPTLQAYVKQEGLDTVPGWGQLVLATSIAPEPLTLARLRIRGAYNAPIVFETHLNALTENGYLYERKDGFHATEKAISFIDTLLEQQRSHLKRLPTLPDSEINQLNSLLKIIYDIALTIDNMPTPCLDDASRRSVPESLIPLEKFLRFVSALTAFRDDCHLAAWHDYDVDGHAWERFTYIWNGQAYPEQLQTNRGFTVQEDQAALESLLTRRWITPSDGDIGYAITPQGKLLRDGAEDATNSAFFAAWSHLTDEQWAQLTTLLEQQQALFTDALEPQQS